MSRCCQPSVAWSWPTLGQTGFPRSIRATFLAAAALRVPATSRRWRKLSVPQTLSTERSFRSLLKFLNVLVFVWNFSRHGKSFKRNRFFQSTWISSRVFLNVSFCSSTLLFLAGVYLSVYHDITLRLLQRLCHLLLMWYATSRVLADC